MIVCVDIDDTLLDTMASVCASLGVPPEMLVQHESRPGWYQHPLVDDARFTACVRDVIASGTIPPVGGSVHGLRTIAFKHSVVLCSSRPASTFDVTSHNIAKYFHPLESRVVCCGPLKWRLLDGFGFPPEKPSFLVDDHPPPQWPGSLIVKHKPSWSNSGLDWKEITCLFM